MSFDESITFRIGGTMRLRWLATCAVLGRFRWYFAVGIVLWVIFGLYLRQVVLHIELTLTLAIPIVVNILGIDPAQLLMRGEVTFTPTQVYWTNLRGRTSTRGWAWVRKAEDVNGDLHIVFGRLRSRAIASRRLVAPSVYFRLRDFLIANGKLAA
jgi:hypothetical protein